MLWLQWLKLARQKRTKRGLRSIVESLLLDTMYDLPSLENLQKVIVEEKTVLDNSSPKLIPKRAVQNKDNLFK